MEDDMTHLRRAVDEGSGAGLSRLESVLVTIAAGGAVGAVAGVVWGGLGGRLAMRIVMLTSSGSVRGVTSDDGFEIGTVSGATLFLFIFSGVLGGVAGLCVGLVRTLLGGRTSLVASGFGFAVALGAGASIVHTDGVDFRFLEPLWLTIGLFVLLPGAWAVSVVVIIDWLLVAGRVVQHPIRRPERAWTQAGGWLVLGTIAVLGGLDLVDDVRQLLRFH
jgi:hypothetical protein